MYFFTPISSHPSPAEFVEVLSEVRRVEERLRPFIERTHSILGMATLADYNNNVRIRDAPIPLFYKPIRYWYFYLCTCRYRVPIPILSRFGLYERSAINLKAVFISSSEDYVKPLVRLYKMNRRLFQAKNELSFLFWTKKPSKTKCHHIRHFRSWLAVALSVRSWFAFFVWFNCVECCLLLCPNVLCCSL